MKKTIVASAAILLIILGCLVYADAVTVKVGPMPSASMVVSSANTINVADYSSKPRILSQSVNIGESPAELAWSSYVAAYQRLNSLEFRFNRTAQIEKKVNAQGLVYYDVD